METPIVIQLSVVIFQSSPHRHVTINSIIFKAPSSFISEDSKIAGIVNSKSSARISIEISGNELTVHFKHDRKTLHRHFE